MNLVFSGLKKNYSHKIKNRGQHLKFNKMTCGKMEDITDF
jgi:hypothetical protein